jgi:hypothetical protein
MRSPGLFRCVRFIAAALTLAAIESPAADLPHSWSRLIQSWGQPLGQGEPVKCGLPIIAHAMRNQSTLPADVREVLCMCSPDR